jgi:hypothetical protein
VVMMMMEKSMTEVGEREAGNWRRKVVTNA